MDDIIFQILFLMFERFAGVDCACYVLFYQCNFVTYEVIFEIRFVFLIMFFNIVVSRVPTSHLNQIKNKLHSFNQLISSKRVNITWEVNINNSRLIYLQYIESITFDIPNQHINFNYKD